MGRFDFTFPRGLTETEVARVETTINGWIRENVPRNLVLMPIEEAKASGAISMAGETYGDTVRVVAYGQRSKELCGGTHVERLGDIGLVKIVSEGSIASGVRRIELVAGDKAYKAFKRFEATVNKLAGALKAPDYELLERVEKLQGQVKALEKTLQGQKEGQLVLQAKALLETAKTQGGKLVHFEEGLIGDDLKTIATTLADSLESYALVLGSNGEDKAHFVVSLSKDKVAEGLNAGAMVKQLATQCDGGGGGKPNYAQAGGKAGHKVASVLQTFAL
jgi:alanyl-tRNA synthetase